MRPEKEINQLIKKINLKASVDLDKRVHEDIFDSQSKHEKQKSAQTPPVFWNIIVKTPISKFAVMAVVIIGFIFITYYFNDSISITTPAFSKIIDNALSKKWVYMFEEDRKSGQIVAEYWYNPSQKKLYYKTKRDYAFVINMVSGDEYEYRNNQITIKKMDDFDIYSGWIAERMPIISNLLDKYQQQGALIQQKESMYNSQPAWLYDIQLTLPGSSLISESTRTYKYSWLVDKNSHLPIICEYTGIHKYGDNMERNETILNSDRYAFDYPDSGPEDIYALGVPSDVNIVDERKNSDQEIQKLIEKIDSIKETKYNSYAVIVREGDYIRRRIIRNAQRLSDEHLELEINSSDYIPNKEQHFNAMGNTFDSINNWINESGIIRRNSINIRDGQFNYRIFGSALENKTPIEMSRQTTYSNHFFFYCWRYAPAGVIINNSYSEDNSLICTQGANYRSYYDPAKEYMCVRIETDEGGVSYEIQEFNQTASGMLYPSKVRERYYSRVAGSDERIAHYTTSYIYADDVTEDLKARLDPKLLPNFVDHRKLTIEVAAQFAQEDTNDIEYTGFTPLHMAIYRQDIERVEALLKNGAEVEPTYDSGATPMELAVSSGNLELVKLLYDHGADFISNDKEQRDALGLAVKEGYQKIAEFMLSHGSNVNNNYKKKDKPLKYAADNGNLEMVKMLLEYNPQIDPKDTEGRTPLYHSVVSLLDKVANPTPTDEEIVQKFEDIITLLIEHGADINTRDNQENTSLLTTITYYSSFSSRINEQQLDLIRFLLKMGADPDLAYDNGSPLWIAAQGRLYDIVKILLEAGADPWQQTTTSLRMRGYYNLLMYARRAKDDKMYDLLYPYMKEKYEKINKELIELTKQVIIACIDSDEQTINAICVDHPSFGNPWDKWSENIRNFYEGNQDLIEEIIPGWFTDDGLAQTYIPLPEGSEKKSILLGFILYPDNQWKCICYSEENYMPVFEQPVSLIYDLKHGLDDFRNFIYENTGLTEKIKTGDSGTSTLHGKFKGQLVLTVQDGNLKIDFEEENWRKRYFVLTYDSIKFYQGNTLRVYNKEYIQKQNDYPEQLIYHPLELIINTGQSKLIFTVNNGQIVLTQGNNTTIAERFVFDLDTWQVQ